MSDATFVSTDPVCGLTVDASTALYAEVNGLSLYFCSEACRTRFCPGPPVPGQYSGAEAAAEAAGTDRVPRRA